MGLSKDVCVALGLRPADSAGSAVSEADLLADED
jgi:hypothetical protein